MITGSKFFLNGYAVIKLLRCSADLGKRNQLMSTGDVIICRNNLIGIGHTFILNLTYVMIN